MTAPGAGGRRGWPEATCSCWPRGSSSSPGWPSSACSCCVRAARPVPGPGGRLDLRPAHPRAGNRL